MSGAGSAIASTSERFDEVKFWGNLELEIQQDLDAELRKVHEIRKKYIIEEENLAKKLQLLKQLFEEKLQGELTLRKKKAEMKLQEELKKKKFKDIQEKSKYEEKEQNKLKKKLAEYEKLERRKIAQEEFDEKKRLNEELTEAYGVSLKRNMEMAMESLNVAGLGEQVGTAFKKAGAAAAVNVAKAGAEAVNDAMTMFSGVYSKINARLLGSGTGAKDIVSLMNKNLAVSPFVKYEAMLDNVASLVEQGIAYNVELRAFLMTVTDKVAATFNAANGTLLKIIRIQQEDSTRARMGMEASLTSFLNSNFLDSSYLTDLRDSVSDAIADSVVLLGTKGGAEYEYNVLKWLSSLYSLGLSNNTVTSLASAINMLATGDVEGLAGSGMLNLIVMAANRSGMNYGDLLTSGVSAANVDDLMANIVSYWGELSTNKNQVVRLLYASLFGLDMSDLVAIRNVDLKTLDMIKSNNLSYAGMLLELNNQLNAVAGRMHVSELINNAYENAIAGIGRTIAGSPGLMATWLVNDLIKDATGGINIPFINAMGFGLDLNTDLNSIIQLGMVGIGTLGLIGNIIGGLGSKGGLNLSRWNAEDVTKHGGGLGAVVTGVLASTSLTTFVGNSEGSDIYESSLNKAYDDTDKSVAAEATEDADKMKKAIVEHIDPNIQTLLELMQSVHTGNTLRVTVENYGLTF